MKKLKGSVHINRPIGRFQFCFSTDLPEVLYVPFNSFEKHYPRIFLFQGIIHAKHQVTSIVNIMLNQ